MGRLAQTIAQRIFDNGCARRRCPRPAADQRRHHDLLPRRGILQELLSAPQAAARGGAGADRLALIDEIAVMDPVALGDTPLLLPEGPDVTQPRCPQPCSAVEEALFDLAYARRRQPLPASARGKQPAAVRQGFQEAPARAAGPGGLSAFVSGSACACSARRRPQAPAAGASDPAADRSRRSSPRRSRSSRPLAVDAGVSALAARRCHGADP